MDSTKGFKEPDEVSFKIANHILDFILHEVEKGSKFNRFFSFFKSKIINQSKGIPKTLLPFQSGVGNVANAVLACIGK